MTPEQRAAGAERVRRARLRRARGVVGHGWMIGQRVRRPRDRAVGTITATVMPEPGWRRLCVLWDGPPGHVFEQFCDVDTIERWHGEPPPIELPPEHLPNTELVEADLTAQLGLDLGW